MDSDSFQMTAHTGCLSPANILCKGRPKWSSFAKRKLLLENDVQAVPMKWEDSPQVNSKQELWTVFDQNSQKLGHTLQPSTLHSREQDQMVWLKAIEKNEDTSVSAGSV